GTRQPPGVDHICLVSSSSTVGQARPQRPQLSGSVSGRQTGGVPHGCGSKPALQDRPQVHTPPTCEQVADPLAIPGQCCVPPQVCGLEKSVSQPSRSSPEGASRRPPPEQSPKGN